MEISTRTHTSLASWLRRDFFPKGELYMCIYTMLYILDVLNINSGILYVCSVCCVVVCVCVFVCVCVCVCLCVCVCVCV